MAEHVAMYRLAQNCMSLCWITGHGGRGAKDTVTQFPVTQQRQMSPPLAATRKSVRELDMTFTLCEMGRIMGWGLVVVVVVRGQNSIFPLLQAFRMLRSLS